MLLRLLQLVFGFSIYSQILLVGRSDKFETSLKSFDFYIIWKPLMKGFKNGLIFLNLAKWFWRNLNFSAENSNDPNFENQGLLDAKFYAVFKNRTSFPQESQDESNIIMKSHKFFWPCGLGPKSYIWATWAQKTYQAIGPEPQLQFSQTGPHFLNHEIMQKNNEISKKFLTLGPGPQKLHLGHLGPKGLSSYISPIP